MKFREIKKSLKMLSKGELKELLEEINILLSNSVELSYTELRLQELKINSACPYCNSSIIVKNGRNKKGSIRYKCTECNKTFTRYTNTILECSNYGYEIWLEVLHSAINHSSILSIQEILKRDYGCLEIDDYTVWMLRMKLIYVISSLYYSQNIKLSGVIQIDETCIREAQKGSRNLVSMIEGEDRKARYGYHASKYGVLGPEFSTVVTAIDERGYCVCYVVCLGKLTSKLFENYFVKHFENITYLCSDANNVYNWYCDYENIAHYIKPSDYLTEIKRAGYLEYTNTKEDKEKNKRILKGLYEKGLIDKIENYGKLSYSEFEEIKRKNKLSLGRVNELHKDIKLYIEKQMTNVSMDLLEYYIGFFSYIRNWRVANGRYPSSKEDAALILDEVLKAQIKISTKEIRKMEGNKARPSKRYVNELVENTGQAREVLAEERFKFREEDNVDSFSRKKILEQFTKADINKMFRECGYTGRMYSKWTNTSKIGAILRSDRCDELIFRYMKERRRQVLDDEDIKEEEWKKYE